MLWIKCIKGSRTDECYINAQKIIKIYGKLGNVNEPLFEIRIFALDSGNDDFGHNENLIYKFNLDLGSHPGFEKGLNEPPAWSDIFEKPIRDSIHESVQEILKQIDASNEKEGLQILDFSAMKLP